LAVGFADGVAEAPHAANATMTTPTKNRSRRIPQPPSISSALSRATVSGPYMDAAISR